MNLNSDWFSFNSQLLARQYGFGGVIQFNIISNAFDFQLNIQKEEAKKKEVHVEENVPAPSPRSNCTVMPTLVFVNNSVE